MEQNKLKYLIACAIVEKLWLKGLFTDEEQSNLKEKIKIKIFQQMTRL